MARIPTLDSFTQTPNTAPTGRFNSSFEARGARANLQEMQNTGETIRSYGDQLMDQESAELEKFNKLRVQDATNQLLNEEARLTYDPMEGFTNRKGKDAFTGAKGGSLQQEYAGKYSQSANKIAEGLSNPTQRQIFQQVANERLAALNMDIVKHYATEARNYEDSVYDGTIKTLSEQMPRYASNPETLARVIGTPDDIGSITGAAMAKARLRGLSEGEALADANKIAAIAIKNTITASTDLGDYDTADRLYNTYGEKLGSEGISLIKPIKILKDTRQAQAALQEGTRTVMWRADDSDMGRLHRLLLNKESGLRQFASDGTVLKSKSGMHYGIGQVGEAAAQDAAKALGVEYSAERLQNDENYNATISRKYLEMMIEKYKGDLSAALGAYNWGAGNVEKAMAESNKKGGSWLNYAPAETQDYVSTIMRGFNGGGDVATAKATSKTYVEAALAQLPPDASPEAKANVQELASKQYEVEVKQRKEIEDVAVEQAISMMRDQGKTWSELPVGVRSAIPASRQDDIRKAGVNTTTTNEGFVQYTELMSNPTKLRSMTRSEVYALGRDMDQEKLSKLLEVQEGKNSDIPHEATNSAVRRVMTEMGVKLGQGANEKDKQKEAQWVSYMYDAVDQEQRRTGKKLNEVEIDKLTRGIMRRQVNVDGGIFGADDRPLMDVRYKNIPKATRRSIEAMLKQRYPDLAVDESAVLREYINLQRIQTRAKPNGDQVSSR